MGRQSVIRNLGSIFILLWITLFSVSSQAENCHESNKKKTHSNFTKQTVQYDISDADIAETVKCCKEGSSGICCDKCNSCKITSGTLFVNEYIKNNRAIKIHDNKVFNKNFNIEVSIRDLVSLKCQRMRHTYSNSSTSNTPLKFRSRVLQI